MFFIRQRFTANFLIKRPKRLGWEFITGRKMYFAISLSIEAMAYIHTYTRTYTHSHTHTHIQWKNLFNGRILMEGFIRQRKLWQDPLKRTKFYGHEIESKICLYIVWYGYRLLFWNEFCSTHPTMRLNFVHERNEEIYLQNISILPNEMNNMINEFI